jgi:ribosomal-protein-alanine N-acetyltransferase
MPFGLRLMESRDVPVVTAIDRVSFPTPWPEGAFHRELQREHASYFVLLKPQEKASQPSSRQEGGWLQRLFGMQQGSRVIGYVGFRLEGGGGHITTIALRPEWRGRGFGELLLLIALEKMINRGVDLVMLEMRPSNDVAHQLYRKYGFRVVRSRRSYYRDGEDAWVMAANVGDEEHRGLLSDRREALEERLNQQEIDVGQIIDRAL